jgi:hypothetical protein
MKKRCKVCGKNRLIKFFHSHSSCAKGVRAECKTCHNKVSKVRHKKYIKENPDKRRSTVLKNKYGVTFEQYRAMLGAQGNACKICGSFSPGASKDHFSIDHDHKTGKIRGILCHGCNAGLGMFKEDTQSLKQAICYLDSHVAVSTSLDKCDHEWQSATGVGRWCNKCGKGV